MSREKFYLTFVTPIHDGRVGRAQRTGESGRHTQSQHRECPVASLAQARGRREMGTVEFLRQGAQRGLGLERESAWLVSAIFRPTLLRSRRGR